ncbi:MAG: hypothetical protein VKK80_05215 [Prochlorothrix sp.]|nr:hypothetical protein [Prochlorothrix sp.]
MDSPGLLPDSAEPPSSLKPSASSLAPDRPLSAPVPQNLTMAELAPKTWSFAHVVGIFMAGLTLVLPLLTIMSYSDSAGQSNPSLLLPVDTSPQ